MIGNKMQKFMLFIFLGNVLVVSSENVVIGGNSPVATSANEASKESKPSLAEEYKNLQAKKTTIKEKFFSVLGHRVINSQNSPELYKVVVDLCAKLNMPVPYVTIFKGNVINNGISALIGLDFRANAFAFSLIQRLGLICIGSDLIEQLSYDEIRSIIAHELAHIKCYHVIKKIGLSLVVSKALGKVVNSDFVLCNLSKKLTEEQVVHFAFITFMLSQSLMNAKGSRIFEKEADLKALSITNDKNSLIGALKNIHEIAHERCDRSISGKISALFSSHPSNKERAEYLAIEAAKLSL